MPPRQDALADFLSDLDCCVSTLPLTRETRDLIDATTIAATKKGLISSTSAAAPPCRGGPSCRPGERSSVGRHPGRLSRRAPAPGSSLLVPSGCHGHTPRIRRPPRRLAPGHRRDLATPPRGPALHQSRRSPKGLLSRHMGSIANCSAAGQDWMAVNRDCAPCRRRGEVEGHGMARGTPRKQQGGASAGRDSGATTGHEAELRAMADAPRGSTDAAEYKHVVPGLIFLKYISDAFEARHAAVLAEWGVDAAEDRDENTTENIFWVPPDARSGHLKEQRGSRPRARRWTRRWRRSSGTIPRSKPCCRRTMPVRPSTSSGSASSST